MRFLWGVLTGVLGSLIAYFIIISCQNYIIPTFKYREASELYNQGRVEYFNLEFANAEKSLTRAIEIRNSYAQAHAAISHLYSLWATYNDALGKRNFKNYSALSMYHAVKALQYNPTNIEGIRALTLAVSCPEVFDLSIANKLYDEAIKKNPNDSELAYALWVINGKKIQSEIDRKPIEDAINSNEDFIFAKIDYARTLFLSGKAENDDLSLEILHKIPNNEKIALVQNLLGVVYGKKEELGTAKKHFSKSLELDYHGAAAHTNLGTVCRFQGEFENAVSHYENAKKFGNLKHASYINLGLTLVELKRFQKAISVLKEGLKVTDFPESYALLAIAYWELGSKEVAKYFLSIAISKEPEFETTDWIPDNHGTTRNTAKELIKYFKE